MTTKSGGHFLLNIKIWGCIAASFLHYNAFTQDVGSLIKKVKSKLDKVNDYRAEGIMKTDVAFIKTPAGYVNILYKRPDKFKLKRSNGISLLPKGGIYVNVGSLLGNTDYVSLAAGESSIQGTKVEVIKLLPSNENGEVVLTTLYIDEANFLIRKASTTTRESGTYEIEMSYGKYGQYGLPDKIIFSFNTKDFKLPKGLTMEFESGEKKTETGNAENKKGKIEISYSNYIINKGIADSEFR